MKKKELKSWRTKSDSELKTLIETLEAESVKLKLELKTGRLKNFRAVREKRLAIAVAKTIQRERALGLAKQGKEVKQ